MAELQKQFDEEKKKDAEIQKEITELRQANSQFFEGPDDKLEDEIERLHATQREVKAELQHKIRPLKDWERLLKEQQLAEQEKLTALQAENAKLEKSFPQPKPVKGAPPAPVARPYLDQGNKLAESMRQSLDMDLQLREARTEAKKLDELVEEKNKLKLKSEQARKDEQSGIDQLNADKVKLAADLQKVTTAFESKQLNFMRDMVALEGRIDSISKSQ